MVSIEGEENWSYLDSFYFTLITMTTIGFSELHPLSSTARLFIIVLIFLGVGTTAYTITTSAQIFLDGRLKEYFESKKMQKRIDKLNNHYIICGFGRIGRYISEELNKLDFPFIVIETDKNKIEEIQILDMNYVEGDATTDSVLKEAMIEESQAIIIAVGQDAASVFITLSARGLNEDIYILARYEQLGTDQKLYKAGANKALSPHLVSGGRMVQLLLKPTVTDFLDLATSHEMIELTFEEVHIKKESLIANKSLKESGLKEDFGVIVVGLKGENGDMIFNPPSNTVIHAGDSVIILGNYEQTKRMQALES